MSNNSPFVGQGGQSRGQNDWVHGFPEPVKSFITFVTLSQISCGKVQKKLSYFSEQGCVKVSPGFAVVSKIRHETTINFTI